MFLVGVVVLFLALKPTISQRRIVGGGTVEDNLPYMVYLVKAPNSSKAYDAWICGGCIVHPLFILTSATCLMDVNHVYAIAGYKKYVKTEEIEHDECTKRTKKKVVAYNIHKKYNMYIEYDNYWTARDIALARVESPYDYYDSVYLKYCSYTPNEIRVGYDPHLATEGAEAITFGWGSSLYYRPVGNNNDYNEPYLRYVSLVLTSANECDKIVKDTNLTYNMKYYWICALDGGLLEVNGTLREYKESKGCDLGSGRRNIECKDKKEEELLDYDLDFRRTITSGNKTHRGGPCQNDHGGPLVTWYAGHAYVIGVVTAFLVNAKMECQAPYFFSSVPCHRQFINCVLTNNHIDFITAPPIPQTRRDMVCDAPAKERGFDIIDKNILWPN